jgi:glycosyltransferase involved in cell wall biosynthesis
MSFPLVSIIITSYNRAHWIWKAIESALAQDYPNLEIIISDNCSTDNSDEVIKKYCSDPRIRYSRNSTNIGMLANFEKAYFELATGEYITNISSDDFLSNSQFITRAMRIIKKFENVSVVFGMAGSINEKTNIWRPSPLPSEKFEKECVNGIEVFFDFANNPYYSGGGALYSMRHLKEYNITFNGRITTDIEFNLGLMLYGNIGFINEDVYTIRTHENNASGTNRETGEIENMYLDVYNYMYDKADKVIEDKKALNKWYRKLIVKNIRLCYDMVIPKRNRKQVNLLTRIIFRKYRNFFLLFLLKWPKYIAKIILNR